jgi:HK97 family phage prohead protease
MIPLVLTRTRRNELMPYTIIENATGCDGFAVVKENETTPVPGGCHPTMDDAQAHLVALEIATADEYNALPERSDMNETETRNAGELTGTPVDIPVETEMEPAMNDEPMVDEPTEETATVRYSTLEIENRRVGGRDVEFRSVEVGGLELRTIDGTSDAPIQFSGYAAVFNSPSEPLPFIETIAPGAFRRSLNSGREVRLFINHDMGQPLATTRNGSMRLYEDERGLKVEATLPDTTAARDLATLIDAGVVHSMSFGFSIPTSGDAWSEDGNSRELREIMLVETSIVTGFPAYPATAGTQVRAIDETDGADNSTGMPVALARRMIELAEKR